MSPQAHSCRFRLGYRARLNYNPGVSHDVITFQNAASIDFSDYVFRPGSEPEQPGDRTKKLGPIKLVTGGLPEQLTCPDSSDHVSLRRLRGNIAGTIIIQVLNVPFSGAVAVFDDGDILLKRVA